MRAPYGVLPAVQATASTVPTEEYRPAIEAGLVRSTKWRGRCARPPSTSWRSDKRSDDRPPQAPGGADDQNPHGIAHEAASLARSSSTTDGSSLVNTGVGLSTLAPDRAPAPTSQRGVSE